MTNRRVFLLIFFTVLWISLSGFYKPSANNMLALEIQKTDVEPKLIETKNSNRKTPEANDLNTKVNVISVNTSLQKTKQTTTNATDVSVGHEDNSMQHDEFEKPLDLSVPFKDTDNAALNIENNSATQGQVADVLVPDTKNKPRPLELKGDFVMSPEPEAGKLKSVDGAEIVIKLKP